MNLKALKNRRELSRKVSDGKVGDSNINRVTKWIDSFDICCITACREQIKDLSGNELKEVAKLAKFFTPDKINEPCYDIEDGGSSVAFVNGVRKVSRNTLRDWNDDLVSSLRALGYGVTSVQGFWQNTNSNGEYDGEPTLEESFLVVNLNNDSAFAENCVKLGMAYNQDSILLKFKEDNNAYFWGTNKLRNNHPDCRWNPYFDDIQNVGYYQKCISSTMKTQIGSHSFAFSKKKETSEKDDREYLDTLTYQERKKRRTEKYNEQNQVRDERDFEFFSKNLVKYKLSDSARALLNGSKDLCIMSRPKCWREDVGKTNMVYNAEKILREIYILK